MPCLEITVPRISEETRGKLAAALTEAFVTATGHRREIFGIRFFEYAPGEAAVGGALCGDQSQNSPYIHALLYCPRLKRGQKRALAELLTKAFTEKLDRPTWKPVVHICEHPYDNVIVEGKLLSDAYPECAQKRFYYDLSNDEG